MVSTRGHPKEFPEPDLTPTRSSPSTPSKSSRSRGARKGSWAHTPSNLAIIWLLVSLPLVIWDTGYVMFRPLTMPGGSLVGVGGDPISYFKLSQDLRLRPCPPPKQPQANANTSVT